MRAAAASMYPSPPMPRSEERASGRRPPIYRYRKIDERENDGGGGAARGAFIVVVARKEDTDGEAEATFPLLGDGSEIVFTPGSGTALPSVSPNLGSALRWIIKMILSSIRYAQGSQVLSCVDRNLLTLHCKI